MQEKDFYRLAEIDEKMWYFRSIHLRIFYWLKKLLKGEPACILECGCGTGGLIRFISKKNPRWKMIGLDISILACQMSKKRTNASFIGASVEALPFADNSLEAVIIIDTICQVEDPDLVLRELVRVVKPSGWILINEPALRWLWSFHDEAFMTKHRFSKADFLCLVRSTGIKPILISHLSFSLFPLVLLRRKIFKPRNPKSDFRIFPKPLELIFFIISSLENLGLIIGLRYPIGSSIFLIAQKF